MAPPPAPRTDRAEPRPGLRADCARCAALCCVAPAFAASADFAIDKAAGRPCPNLAADLRCGIHAQLRERGFAGCTAYDCFGAGQRVTQETFGGLDWRDAPHEAPRMFAAPPVVRHLHELLWLLEDALDRPAASPVHPELEVARGRVERLAGAGPDELATLDAADERAPGPTSRAPTCARPTSWAPTSAERTCAGPTCATPCSSPAPKWAPHGATRGRCCQRPWTARRTGSRRPEDAGEGAPPRLAGYRIRL